MYQAEVQSLEFNSCQQARNTSNASIIVIHMVNIKVCVRAPDRSPSYLDGLGLGFTVTNLLLGSIYVKTCQMNHIVIVISASLTSLFPIRDGRVWVMFLVHVQIN